MRLYDVIILSLLCGVKILLSAKETKTSAKFEADLSSCN